MSRISQFKLINGGGYRISYEDETNEQVINPQKQFDGEKLPPSFEREKVK